MTLWENIVFGITYAVTFLETFGIWPYLMWMITPVIIIWGILTMAKEIFKIDEILSSLHSIESSLEELANRGIISYREDENDEEE